MLKLLKGLLPYKWQILLIVSLIGLQASADLMLPYLMSNVVNYGIVNGDLGYILRQGGLMVAIAIGGMASTLTMMYFVSCVSVGFCRDLRQNIFVKVSSLSVHEVDELGTASLITRTTNDITQIQIVLALALRLMVSAPIMIVGAAVMSYRKDASVAAILWVVIPAILVSILAIAFVTMPMFKETQRRLDVVNLVIREKLSGIRVIRVFNKEKDEAARFDRSSHGLAEVSTRANRIMGLMMPLMNLFLNLAIVAVIWFGGQRIASGHLEVGNMMAVIQYFTQLLISLLLLSMVISMVPRAQASAVRIQEILVMQSPLQDPQKPKTLPRHPDVAFENVSLIYGDAQEETLSQVSFTAKSGEITAIIGGTGSGKTTLLNLIPRFFDATGGTVRVGGVDVRDLPQGALREVIGYASQKALLFSGSLKGNLKFGTPGASDDDIEEALRIAQAKDFVSKMPKGIDSHINQGGSNLSGGQKQRLSIARAIIKKPSIYLFDDTFSALDYKTDRVLREGLKEVTRDAAVIIVAQRVSTVQDAHKIIVLEDGRIEDMGTHEELLARCGIYQEIVDSQNQSTQEVE
ncbi:MAG: ABC transporter ATP-binding protein/permease [Turicibacter sp.]|nr:ABC transporter ATP-binding protein/permease [Turicibacter sp.]